ncbi:uncharacterized protein [Triticum aestivum]|uniref:uncharacterized protein n=1 Tax=Triticum aestivum TaxID=4565 RepID=UPI001D0214CB|nr:uncharacterized protein LOC123059640 [Triticum aestivum]
MTRDGVSILLNWLARTTISCSGGPRSRWRVAGITARALACPATARSRYYRCEMARWRCGDKRARRVCMVCLPHTIRLIQQPYWKKTTTQGKDTLSILGDKCGKLLVMNGRGRVYTADLETGAMKEVADGPHARPSSPLDAVLLEMDWPAFFVSRLGADSEETAARRTRQRKGRGGRKTRSPA